MLKMFCEPCRSGTRNTKIGWSDTTNCCATYILSRQPDFVSQKEWLTEEVERAGMQIIFYPKYHCELNYIERIWGWLKSFHRRNCTYNYAHLKEALPLSVQNIPLAFVRRAARSCFRFMTGYRIGLKGPVLDYAMRKYSSHRRIVEGARDAIEAEYSAKLSK